MCVGWVAFFECMSRVLFVYVISLIELCTCAPPPSTVARQCSFFNEWWTHVSTDTWSWYSGRDALKSYGLSIKSDGAEALRPHHWALIEVAGKRSLVKLKPVPSKLTLMWSIGIPSLRIMMRWGKCLIASLTCCQGHKPGFLGSTVRPLPYRFPCPMASVFSACLQRRFKLEMFLSV